MKRNYNYSSLPYKVFNLREMCAKYEKLKMLKNALGFDSDEEMNEDLMFNIVSEHNYNEFYLLEYIINKVIHAPDEVRAQNFLLTCLYNRPEEYKRQYEITKQLYKSEYVFRKYANSIREDLHLYDMDNCKLFNYQIYEICSEYITDKLVLEPADVYLNLHFIQKWIYEQTKFKLGFFTDIEKDIIYHLKSGYCVDELTREDLFKDQKDKDFLNTIIHDILPVKCRVETINQVMATICCHYPNPASIEPLHPNGGMDKFRKMLENGNFSDLL